MDERGLWPDGKAPRTIGQALELAVRGAVTSQKKNPLGAWRYSPDVRDADTSVSGAVFVGLLGGPERGHRGSGRIDRQGDLVLCPDDIRVG